MSSRPTIASHPQNVWLPIAACCALLAPITPAAAETRSSQPPWLETPDLTNQSTAPVLRVISAELVVVELAGVPVRLRLAGVRSPWTSEFLQNLLRGERVYVLPHEQEDPAPEPASDQDNTALSHIDQPSTDSPASRSFTPATPVMLYRAPDGLWINLELVRQGHARWDRRLRGPAAPLFAYYEQAARDHQRGRWDPKSDHAKRDQGDQPDGHAERDGRDDPNESDQRSNNASQDQSRDNARSPQEATDAAPTTVYATPSGRRYHTEDCTYAKSGSPLTLEDAARRGLTPCSRCQPTAKDD